MRDEIVEICADALRGQGYPDADVASVLCNPAHAAAAIALLKDCRPLPVVLDVIAELEPVARGRA
jgi:hypothetical protein